jgi:hypothetical protein
MITIILISLHIWIVSFLTIFWLYVNPYLVMLHLVFETDLHFVLTNLFLFTDQNFVFVKVCMNFVSRP